MSEYHAPSRRTLFAGGALAATTAGVSAFSPAHAEQANKTEEFMTRAPEWVKNTQKRLDEFNKRLQYLTYTDTAREYTAHNLAKNGLHVNALDYCVDPTGVEDCTDQLNKLAERLYWLGGGSIELPAGIYKVSHPFIDLLDKVEFFGHGMSTQIIATSTYKLDDAVRKNRDECFGVFHTGTYRERASLKVTNNRPMRFGVRDMWIRTSTKKGAINVDQLRDNMHAGEPLAHVAGVILHTEFTGKPNAPEAVPSLSNLEIWDVDMGVAILGLHDRGMKVDKIRVRKSLRQGLLVGKPVGHPLRRIDDNNPGGADNKFLTVDISDANLSGKNYAGIEIYASQCKFFGSTSWYNRRSVPKNPIYVRGKRTSPTINTPPRPVLDGMSPELVTSFKDARLKRTAATDGSPSCHGITMWAVSVNPPAGMTRSQNQHVTMRQRTGISARGLVTALSREYVLIIPTKIVTIQRINFHLIRLSQHDGGSILKEEPDALTSSGQMLSTPVINLVSNVLVTR